jgi:hypothetical protein
VNRYMYYSRQSHFCLHVLQGNAANLIYSLFHHQSDSPDTQTVMQGLMPCSSNNGYNKGATQFGSLNLYLGHVIQLKQNHHLDFTRAMAVPHANPINTQVRVFNVSGSKLSELILSGPSLNCGKSHEASRGNVMCYESRRVL